MISIVEKAYDIFSKYKLKEQLHVCTVCCMSEKDKNQLENLPLRSLSYELIYGYNTAATTAKPPLEEFKYFLPRFLELISINNFPSHSIELSLSRFSYYNIEDFLEEERSIMDDFCRQFFIRMLHRHPLPDNESIDSILVMLFKAKADITQLLHIWEKDESASGNKHFMDLVDHSMNKMQSKLSNSFATRELNEVLAVWLNKDDLFDSKYNTSGF